MSRKKDYCNKRVKNLGGGGLLNLELNGVARKQIYIKIITKPAEISDIKG